MKYWKIEMVGESETLSDLLQFATQQKIIILLSKLYRHFNKEVL